MNKKFLLAIPAIALIIACGGNTEGSESDIAKLNEQANGNTSVAPNKAPKKTTPKVTVITDGDWEVGAKDNYAANILTPGNYVVTSPENSIMGCTWTVVKDFSGEPSSYVNAGVVTPGKSGRVVLKKSHGGLELIGDCLAKKKEK